ncbi:hypothetical protein J1N35_024956 [Gossypium stocksii]|uniref:Uncharacterized protein n=1 Tax=Gossypium stocksii TaxID=47602 RepID=A0A9D3V894_9ROSI|nr:hypothetical protein J1N35_024956 [Gossypium stocksii]
METAVGSIWCHKKTKTGLQLESNQVTIAGGEGNNNRSRKHLGQASSRILEELRQSRLRCGLKETEQVARNGGGREKWELGARQWLMGRWRGMGRFCTRGLGSGTVKVGKRKKENRWLMT